MPSISRPHIRRRVFIERLAMLAAAFPAVSAQSSSLRRIGLAFGDDPEGGVAAFRQSLAALGYVEGRDVLIEARDSTRSSAAIVAADLAKQPLELIVVHSLPLAIAVRAVNPAMPMVIVTTPGFVINGFAKTLERPGGLYTGIDELVPGLTGRRLELLKTAAPTVSRIALLSTTPGEVAHEAQLRDAQDASVKLALMVKPYRATSIPELEQAFTAIVADRMDGLLNFQGALSYVNRQRIVSFAAGNKLPAIYQATVFAEAGGLMTWAPDLVDQFRNAAGLVAEILKGAAPGSLPIRYPARYFLTLNAKAAENLGLTFPSAILAKADRVLR